MQFNSDLKAEVAIVGHATFKGSSITQYLRPGIVDHSAVFAEWKSGAGIFTTRSPSGSRQVHAVTLYRFSPKSDPARIAELLQADLADNQTTRAVSELPGLDLSTVTFDSHSLPIPLPRAIGDNIYGQIYHQFQDGSTS